jgi:hypothetical protein
MTRWQPQKKGSFPVVGWPSSSYHDYNWPSSSSLAAFFGDEEGFTMSSANSGDSRQDFDRPIGAFLDHPELPLSDVITSEHVRQAFTKHHVLFGLASNVVFTPCVTLWAMLCSVTGIDKSCAAACVRVSVLLLALSRPKWSEDTGVFCRARARMPVREQGKKVGEGSLEKSTRRADNNLDGKRNAATEQRRRLSCREPLRVPSLFLLSFLLNCKGPCSTF